MNFIFSLFSVFVLGILLTACNGGAGGEHLDDAEGNELNEIPKILLEDTEALKTNINGKIFSIPSPVQMVTLLKKENDVFNENLLTDPNLVESYTVSSKRALIMGVYGADLGYATIYDNNSKALSYFNALDKLSNDLGLSGAFDGNLLERFIENGNNQDSLLVIMSEGYRGGDQFLKDNKQHDVAALILVGGWVEALYFASEIYSKTKSQAIANRIGEQATALSTFLALLSEYNTDNKFDDLIADFTDLQADFNKIDFEYVYAEPVQYPEKSMTHIKSTSAVVVNEKVLSSIDVSIKKLRNKIIG